MKNSQKYRLVHVLSYALVVALLETTLNAQTMQWQFMNGPWRATDVRQISASPNDNVIYAANFGSYLVKSTNNGNSWARINDIPHPLVVSRKIDNPSIVVAGYVDGSNYGKIMYSAIGGDPNTWVTKINQLDLMPYSLSFSGSDAPQYVRIGTNPVGGNKALWKGNVSPGGTWTYDDKFTANTTVTSVLYHPENSSIIWVGGSSDNTEMTHGLWYTFDGGATPWNKSNDAQIRNKNITALAYDPTEPDPYVLAGTSDGGIYYSLDNGLSWSISIFRK